MSDCTECGGEIDRRERPRARFCSEKCRYRFRDRERYAADPEGERAKARRYYAANREKKLAYMARRNAEARGLDAHGGTRWRSCASPGPSYLPKKAR